MAVTPNVGLPLIDTNMSADVPRDMNALANAVDTKLPEQLALKAPLDSAALTGTPTAPTAAVDTSTTQLATTAFVTSQAATVAPVMDGAATVGTSKRYAREDHRHPTDTSRAPLASPGLTGAPTAPTASAGTNTTQIATTAFVRGEVVPATDDAALLHWMGV